MKTKIALTLGLLFTTTTGFAYAETNENTIDDQLNNPVVIDDMSEFDINDPNLNDEDREELNKERDYYYMTSTGYIIPPTVNPHKDIVLYNSAYNNALDNIKPSDQLVEDNNDQTDKTKDNQNNVDMNNNQNDEAGTSQNTQQSTSDNIKNNIDTSDVSVGPAVQYLPETGEESPRTSLLSVLALITGLLLLKQRK